MRQYPGLHRLVLISILTCVSCLAAMPPAHGEASGAAEKIIPSEICRGYWLVPVLYRDGPDGTLLLVLDTGASHTSVDPDSLKRVFRRRFKVGKRVTLKDGTAGPLQLNKMRVEVHSMDHLARALGHEIDGILGFDTFRSLLLTLDYPRGEIRVGSGALPEVDGVTILKDVGRDRPYLALEFGDEKLAVVIDSGSNTSFRLHDKDSLTWKAAPRPTSASVGYSQVRIDRAGRINDDVRVGALVVEQPVVETAPQTRILGEQIMRRFSWTFDQKTRRVRVIPDGPDPIRIDPVRGSGLAFRPVKDGFRVLEVFPGTPASAADIRKDDLVIAIEGVPVDDRDCESAASTGGRESTLYTIVRDGQTRDVRVGIVTLVP